MVHWRMNDTDLTEEDQLQPEMETLVSSVHMLVLGAILQEMSDLLTSLEDVCGLPAPACA